MTTFDGIKLTARREVVERTRDRSFLISTMVTLLILGAVIVIPKLFGSDSNTFDVGLVGPASQRLGPALVSQAAAADVKVRLQSPADTATAEGEVRSGKLDAAVVDGSQVIVKEQPNDRLALIVQSASRTSRAQEELASHGLNQSEIRAALAPPPLPVRSIEPTDENATAKKSIATIAVFLLYGQIIGYCMGVASGVVEEKATRVVEVLLATVRPVQLLAGKVIGIGLVGLLQLLLIGAIGLVLAVSLGTITLPAGALGTIGIVLLWFVLGYAFYASLFAVAGAVVSRQEELQNSTTPLTLVLVASFFVAITSAFGSSTTPLAKVCTYLPPTAPLIVPLRIAAGDIAAWQVGLTLAIMLASTVVVVLLASRIYAGAILRTGARVKLKDAWRSATRAATASRQPA
ncbi:MAG TPA: ABC transporter permease [Actinomycetota bacterium]